MEVITTRHGPGKLATKVFVASESGFNVTSTIIMGQKECVLIDTQWTRSNAHRVIAEICETGLHLKAIYCTHAHPDHYWGLGIISEAFPDAKCYVDEQTYRLYNDQYQAKLDEWTERIGETNLCRKQCDRLEVLDKDYIELEGERIEIIYKVMGDYKWNSAVWIPSIKTLIGSDILFNNAHPFTCEVTYEQREQWIADIERLEKLEPEVVIPGHQKEGCLLDRSSMEFTKAYLRKTQEVYDTTKDSAHFFYEMIKAFPDASLVMLSDEMNAEVLKGDRAWDWTEDEDK